MRVLVLGGAGMLGHKVFQILSTDFETVTTVRTSLLKQGIPEQILSRAQVVEGVDASHLGTVTDAIDTVRPEVVVNCVGIIKQIPAGQDPVASITVNSLFPHKLQAICADRNARLVHMSTDCVFSGRKGMYTEDDNADPTDLYGRSKLLGEVQGDNCLTIRTSIIGRELDSTHGLLEWFLSQPGPRVRGYTNAIFSGLPTLALSSVIANVIRNFPDLHGLYHVSSDPISKFELLRLFAAAFDKPVEIEPFAGVQVDRSLNSDRFRSQVGYTPQPWPELVAQMADDPTPYGDWRSRYGH